MARSWQQRQRAPLLGRQGGGVDDALRRAAERGIERALEGEAVLFAMQDIFDRLPKRRPQHIDGNLADRRIRARLHRDVRLEIVARNGALGPDDDEAAFGLWLGN